VPAPKYADPIKAASKKTNNGRVVDIRVYVYPDGHGNFVVGDANLPVANPEQAIGLFAAAWEQLRSR
jgi:hypothetical protein